MQKDILESIAMKTCLLKTLSVLYLFSHSIAITAAIYVIVSYLSYRPSPNDYLPLLLPSIVLYADTIIFCFGLTFHLLFLCVSRSEFFNRFRMYCTAMSFCIVVLQWNVVLTGLSIHSGL